MAKFSKGDYIHTIPLNTVLVKKRFRDEKNKIWYTVRTFTNSKFYVPNSLVKGLASEKELKAFHKNKQEYEKTSPT